MTFFEYFQSYEGYFWQWEEDEGICILTTRDGLSIAYDATVFEVFESLSSVGAPPFGSLVMALMATDESPTRFLDYLEDALYEMEAQSGHAKNSIYYADKALRLLQNFAALPVEYKTGDKRNLMFATVFSKSHNGLKAKRVAQYSGFFNEHNEILFSCLEQIPFSQSNFTKDVKALALLSEVFPTTKSILDAILGVPFDAYGEDVQEKITELKDSDNPFELVEKLIEGNETFYVGSLIRRLWSGLNINMRHRSPSDQPLDGVSDITNKGDVSRLLLSEFAHDEDVFVQRIANHEALYILREVPPESNQLDRVFLLDSSIKCWGNVRTINHAIAFAIAKHPNTDIHSKVYALSNSYKEIFLNNIHEIINGLNVLSPNLDCISGIESYLENEYQKNQEIFFITSEDQLQNVDIQNILKTHQDKIGYVIFTSEKGEIKIFKLLKSGKKHVQDLKLNLDELWQKKTLSSPVEYHEISQEVPILYPSQKQHKILELDSICYKISNKLILKFHRNRIAKGFELLAHIPWYNSDDPENALLFHNELGEIVFVFYDDDLQQLDFFNLHKELRTQIPIQVYGKVEFYLNFNEPFFIVNRESYFLISEKEIEAYPKIDHYEDDSLIKFQREFKKANRKVNVLNNIHSNVHIATYLNNYGSATYLETKHVLNFHVDNYILNQNTFSKVRLNFTELVSFELIADLVLKRVGKHVHEAASSIAEALSWDLDVAYSIASEGASLNAYNRTLNSNMKYDALLESKAMIEKSGCVCYAQPKFWASPDCSEIHLKDGILRLRSSDHSIPTIFIPFVTGLPSALATNEYFAGNEYFLPYNCNLNIIGIDEFHLKFIQPFINNIVNHGVKA